MKIIFCLIIFISAVSVGNQSYAGNWFWDTDHALTAGYRRDTITTDIKALDSSGETITTDDLEGNSIDIVDFGAQGSVTLCNTLLIKGLAEFGWIKDGTYKDVNASTTIQTSKGKICERVTRDYSLAAGYCFTCIPFIRVAPLLGYAYNFQEIEMKYVATNGVFNSNLSDLRYHMSWEGPWIGFDTKFQALCFRLNFGYEYHWSQWRAKWLLEGDDVDGVVFSDKRKANDAYGHVAFIEGSYSPFRCWSLGLGFKYQYWEAPNGSVKPTGGSFSSVGFSSIDKGKVRKATWESYQAKLMIGCSF